MSKDEGKLTQKQRDYLIAHPGPVTAARVMKLIEEHGEGYDPWTDWWPNKYPDM